MRYSLVICNGNHFKREIKGYTKLMGLNLVENNLEDIITFTSKFNDLRELKQFLTGAGLMNPYEYSANIAIGEFKAKAFYPKTLFFNLNYKEDLPYFNQNYLIECFQEHLEEENFLKSLYYRFFNHDFSSRFLLNIYHNLKVNGYLEEKEKETLKNFFTSFIIKFTAKHDRIKGYYGCDFKKLKLLVDFTIHYLKVNNEQTEVKLPRISTESLKLELQNLEMLLKDNPTLEETEAYTNRLKEINKELADLKFIYDLQNSQKRYYKKEKTCPY